MAKGVRVNLSVSEQIDGLLTELAQLSGRSKASFVMEAVGFQLPNWRKQLHALKFESGATLVNTVTVKGQKRTDDPISARRPGDRWKAAMTPDGPESPDLPPVHPATLSRQQRRALQRQYRKKGIAPGNLP